MARTPLASAAVHVLRLVPDCVLEPDQDDSLARVRWLDVDQYRSLSTGEQAAYDIARELWLGSDGLARFCLYADKRFADNLLTALTMALGPVIMPVSTLTDTDAADLQLRHTLQHRDSDSA